MGYLYYPDENWDAYREAKSKAERRNAKKSKNGCLGLSILFVSGIVSALVASSQLINHIF